MLTNIVNRNIMEAKIVFITGASSGIGEGCARKFAKEGWNFECAYRVEVGGTEG